MVYQKIGVGSVDIIYVPG